MKRLSSILDRFQPVDLFTIGFLVGIIVMWLANDAEQVANLVISILIMLLIRWIVLLIRTSREIRKNIQ